jgi:hypothetical protein
MLARSFLKSTLFKPVIIVHSTTSNVQNILGK